MGRGLERGSSVSLFRNGRAGTGFGRVQGLCPSNALQLQMLGWHCTTTTVAPWWHWHCTTAVVLHWCCKRTTLVLHWCCTGSVLVLHWHCTLVPSVAVLRQDAGSKALAGVEIHCVSSDAALRQIASVDGVGHRVVAANRPWARWRLNRAQAFPAARERRCSACHDLEGVATCGGCVWR